MTKKPTYEELKKRVQELEKAESELKMTEKNLWEKEESMPIRLTPKRAFDMIAPRT